MMTCCIGTKPILMSLVAVFLASGAASAQSPGAISVEGMLGVGPGWTDAEGRGGYERFAGGLIGLGVSGYVVAAGASTHGGGNYDLVCVVRPDGTCIPTHPNAVEFAILAGRQVPYRSMRLLAGLAIRQGGDVRCTATS
jgi:hypothetical protein